MTIPKRTEETHRLPAHERTRPKQDSEGPLNRKNLAESLPGNVLKEVAGIRGRAIPQNLKPLNFQKETKTSSLSVLKEIETQADRSSTLIS